MAHIDTRVDNADEMGASPKPASRWAWGICWLMFASTVLNYMDRQAIACFDQAMTDVALSENDPVRSALHDYFAWATTTTMSRYHRSADDVPDGLRIPHWSWDRP